MNKKLKNCLIFSLIVATISICSICSGTGGLFFGYIVSISKQEHNYIKNKPDIVEKKVYVENETTQRYIDKNTPGNIYNELLNNSEQHFTIEYKVESKQQFKEYKDFVLVNLENQYNRLSAKFDLDLAKKVRIVIVDDFDVYEKDLNFDYDTDFSKFAAYALGTEIIEIYQNPELTYNKFDLARLLSHELVHIFQFSKQKLLTWDTPRWFIEGTAEAFSYPKEEPVIFKDLKKTASTLDFLDNLLLEDSPEEYLTGYDASHLFLVYLLDKYGEEKIIKLFDFRYPTEFDEHYKNLTGMDAERDYQIWLKTL